MKDTLPLKLRRAKDPGLDCIVCRRFNVDAQIQYGTTGGSAAQGIHLRCIGRALAIRGGRRPEPSGKTYEDGLREALSIASDLMWSARGFNDNPAQRIHAAILQKLGVTPPNGADEKETTEK